MDRGPITPDLEARRHQPPPQGEEPTEDRDRQDQEETENHAGHRISTAIQRVAKRQTAAYRIETEQRRDASHRTGPQIDLPHEHREYQHAARQGASAPTG